MFGSTIEYPNSFNTRDKYNDLTFLQQAKASGINSTTFNKTIMKKIAVLVSDEEDLDQIYTEIDDEAIFSDEGLV